MTSTTVSAKSEQVAGLEADERRLTARIDELTKRILSLQDESEARRLEMSQAFRDRFSKRYADLDVEKALSGYPAHHDVVVFGGVYRLRPPKQDVVLAIDRFCASPEATPLAPISAAERVLLSWFAGVGTKAEMRDISISSLSDRLSMIRKLPEQLMAKLADECSSIDSYLSVVLELELGNS